MKPVIALVGSPNVGKSTLFNKLTGTRQALVADHAGLTRDRIYGQVKRDDHAFILIDTGGLTDNGDSMAELMRHQAKIAIDEADVVVLMVDGRAGLMPADEVIARQLRQVGKPVIVAINKTEGMQSEIAAAEFYALGLSNEQVISAVQGRGIEPLLALLTSLLPAPDTGILPEELDEDRIRLAVVGRPNVGKSTLINRLMGEERVVAYDEPGTTRDSIYIPFDKDGTAYTLIDTAGVRRRSRVSERLEKFSIVKTLQAIDAANVVMLVIDARSGVVDQDLHLAGLVIESGRAVVIAINKWDGMDKSDRDWVVNDIDRRLPFLNFAKTHFISALHGSGVGLLFASVKQAYENALSQIPTSRLTRVLEQAVAEHAPPLVHGRRIKFRYAHLGGKNPPRIIIHGNQTDATPNSYRRYLENYFRDALKLRGTPVMIELRKGHNPYRQQADKQKQKNLSERPGRQRR